MSLLDQPAPDFELESTAGTTTQLAETIDGGPSVVVIFRGHWCSYCAEQLQTFSELSYDMWRHQDVDVLPITVDPIPTLVEMRDRFGLRIQLLSDPSLEVVADYTGVEEHGRRGRIPVPGTFIVDTDGVVRYEHVASTVSDRTYANHVRIVISEGFGARFEDPYPGGYYE